MKNTLRVLAALALFGASQEFSIAQSDVTPPTLAALSFSASSVDVSAAAQVLIIQATITDDQSGVYYCTVKLTSPSGQIVYAGMNLISGTILNGMYEGAITFPKLSEPGTWAVSVETLDFANNDSLLNSSTLTSLTFPGTESVADSTPDVTPPTLVSASFSPTSVNTTILPAAVTVSLHVTDAQAGANFSHLVNFAVIMAPTNAGAFGPFQYLSGTDFTLTSGTPQNGTWTAVKTMPIASGGNWTIVQVILYDAVTNEIILTQSQLSSMGISPILTDTSTATDTTAPTLTGLTFTASTIDTSAALATVLISLSATDDLSGLYFGATTTGLAYTDLYFSSPSGIQTVHSSIVPALLTGLPTAGTWQFTAIWPRFSESGTWTCYYVRITDAVGNTRVYGTSDLVAAGVSSTLIVNEASYVPDGTLTSSGGTVMDSSFGSRAELTVPSGIISSPTTVAIDISATPAGIPAPKGFTSTGSYFANLVFIPPLPTPVPAPGITVVLPLLTSLTPGATVSLYHVDPVIGTAPAMNASGQAVSGTVDASGNSATFLNVVTFSSLIGFITTGSTLGDVNGDGLVNCADVAILKSGFGTHKGQSGYNIAADLNGDGFLDVKDLFIVSRQLKTGVVCH